MPPAFRQEITDGCPRKRYNREWWQPIFILNAFLQRLIGREVMTRDLNKTLATWLEEMSVKAPDAIEREIDNRVGPYQELRNILSGEQVVPTAFYKQARQCTIMTFPSRFADSALKGFFADDLAAGRMLRKLLNGMPKSARHVPVTIDAVIEEAEYNSQLQKSQLAVIVSLILTVTHPDRFIDYPGHKRWEAFARRLGYGLGRENTYGHRIVWASEFAHELSQTDTFRANWPEERFLFPLWVVSALHWANKDLEKLAH